MTDTIYIGQADFQSCEYEVHIWNARQIKKLPPRLDLYNHSPTGVSWGYAGSGPAQLALALLADATGKDDLALKYHQKYKSQVVAHLPENWQLPISEVSGWVRKQEKENEPVQG